nr:killer cell lectin-like receptor subfamily B member 1B allele C [Anolis sagrei ordinatus]
MNKEMHPTRIPCQLEDGPCYFNFRPRLKDQRVKVKSHVQDHLWRHSRWHQFLHGFGCMTILLLMGAVIALGVWAWWIKESLNDLEKKIHVFHETSSQTPSNVSQQKIRQDNHQALLQYLCKSYGNHSTSNFSENPRCILCPESWLLHEHKCYWISQEKQTWNKSRHDCTAKVSKLAVIKEKEELDFLQHITDGAQLLWLGLIADPSTREWSWVEGSPLNNTLLQVTGDAQANSCGMLKGNKIISEACSAVTKWICETEALLV